MKKRKILYFLPVFSLLLTGCDFASIMDKTKDLGGKIVNPIKDLINPDKEGDNGEGGGNQEGEGGNEEGGGGEEQQVVAVSIKELIGLPAEIEQGAVLAASSLKATVIYSDNTSKTEDVTKVELDTSKVGEALGKAYVNTLVKEFTINVKAKEEKHVHTFNNKIEESKFLASSATCSSPAKYYYSCQCGEKGEETFESSNKELGEHIFEKTKVEYKDLDVVAIYEEKCSECDESKGIHFDEKMNVKRKIYIDDNVHQYIDTYNIYWSKDPIINKYFFNTFVFDNNLKQYHNDEKYVFTDIDCNDPLQLKSYEGIVKQYWYYPECHEWKINRYISVKFDQEGRLVEYTKLGYDFEGIYQQDLITYFGNGEYSISSKEMNWNNELVLRSTTNGKYDENLEIEHEEIISYFEDTNPTQKEVITNDKANNKTTHVNYRQNYENPEELVLESTLEVFFDNNHNIIKQEKTEYTIFGETEKSYKTFEYDNFGNLCKEITYCYDSTIDDYYLAESTIREFVSLDSWIHITTLNYELKENSSETAPFLKQEKYFEEGFSFDITYEFSGEAWLVKNFEKKLAGEHYDLLYFESYHVSYGEIWYPNKYITTDVRFEGKTKYWTVIYYDYAPETTDGWVISEKEEYSTVVETEALYENDYTITYYEWDSELEEWIPSYKEVCYHGDDFEYFWDEETQEWILDE